MLRPPANDLPGTALEQAGRLIGEDPSFQRRAWRLERMAWIAMSFVILAGLIGAFGHGPLSYATAHGRGVLLDYQRILRTGLEYELILRLHDEAQGSTSMRVDKALLDAFSLLDVQPTPARNTSDRDGLVIAWEPKGQGPSEIVLRVKPRIPLGLVAGVIAVGESRVALRMVVLP